MTHASSGRDQSEGRNQLRVRCNLGDSLHHMDTIDTQPSKETNHTIGRRKIGIVHDSSSSRIGLLSMLEQTAVTANATSRAALDRELPLRRGQPPSRHSSA